MEYEIGRVGRIVVMRLHDNDPIYASIEGAAQKEHITSAAVRAGAPEPESPAKKILMEKRYWLQLRQFFDILVYSIG
jgi:hypothetical protein